MERHPARFRVRNAHIGEGILEFWSVMDATLCEVLSSAAIHRFSALVDVVRKYLVGGLNLGSICLRIAEWDSELNDVRSPALR